MQSAGGFIIDDLASVFNIEEPNGALPKPEKTRDEVPEDDVATPKQLSPKQEAKLRSFLDASLDTLSRGYRKRFDPASPLTTLTLYLTEWRRVIGVLARVPPYGSGSTNLLVSYLLRCSTDLCDGIAGYGLGMEIEQHRRNSKRQKTQPESEEPTGSDSEADEEEDRRQAVQLRHRQLNLVLQTLDLIDRLWAAILRGNLINFNTALSNSISAYSDPDDSSSTGTAAAAAPFRNKFEAARLTTSFVASPAMHQRSSHSRESLPVHGGKGHRTVGVTDQVRLRNIAISSREKLFAWMRTELDAPPPPTLEADPGSEPPDNTIDGIYAKPQEETLDVPAAAEDVESPDSADGQDPDMEDVDIQHEEQEAEGYDRQEDTAEHRHFQDLFDRKIDPDEDDEDEEDAIAPLGETEADNDDELGASVAGSVAAVREEGDGNQKRKRDDEEDADTDFEVVASAGPSKRVHTNDTIQAPNGMSRSEIGSLDISLSDGVGQWDLAFTRLFSKTLRTLSDLSEFSGKKAEPKSASTSHNQVVAGTEREEDDDE